ncbi:hypothetical protein LCGC14_0981150 [marine sediment metagenome]|uniref:Uncharacterized protein n=1 Tax=marine sediment metagenome TaxID=412755 RepID=A0A0F9RFB2_9ZZZZ
MKNYNEQVEYQRHVLEYIIFNLADIVDAGQLKQMTFTEDPRDYADSVIRRIRYFILGRNTHNEVTEDVVKTYPATMWEELKRDFWPGWLIRRYPVRYSRDVKHVLHKHYNVCPHLNAPQGKHLDFMVERFNG